MLGALPVERDLDDRRAGPAPSARGDKMATWRSITPAVDQARTRRSAVAGETWAASASSWFGSEASCLQQVQQAQDRRHRGSASMKLSMHHAMI